MPAIDIRITTQPIGRKRNVASDRQSQICLARLKRTADRWQSCAVTRICHCQQILSPGLTGSTQGRSIRICTLSTTSLRNTREDNTAFMVQKGVYYDTDYSLLVIGWAPGQGRDTIL